MITQLSSIDVRILGSLIEKQLTTPDYYPLTLNSLVAACNQKSSRNPVMLLSESEVHNALVALKSKHLVWFISPSTGRTMRYDHNFKQHFELTPAEVAVMAVLMLRGPQTVGEIRTRTERMHQFESLDEVESVLNDLMNRDENSLVTRLERRAGHKECRYMQLLGDSVDIESAQSSEEPEHSPDAIQISGSDDNDRIAALEEDVAQLRDEIALLKNQFSQFKSQFE